MAVMRGLEPASTLAGMTAGVIAVRLTLHKCLFKPLSAWQLGLSKQADLTDDISTKLRHRQRKLCESLWKATAYTFLLWLGTKALYNKPWALDTSQWWSHLPHQQLEKDVRRYYGAELAFYSGSLAMLTFWEERRRDYYVMLTHHMITVALIWFSYQAGFGRVGSVVMLLHDPSDVFLEFAKVFQYIGQEAIAIACFSLLLLSWGILRLCVLPCWLIRSAILEQPAVAGGYPEKSKVFIAMLCALVCMHLYWFALIVRIAWASLVLGDHRDTREDDA